jgi:hypothetical protein
MDVASCHFAASSWSFLPPVDGKEAADKSGSKGTTTRGMLRTTTKRTPRTAEGALEPEALADSGRLNVERVARVNQSKQQRRVLRLL